MFEVEDIRDWRDLAVLDTEGSKIGTLEAVYFDTATQEATIATVKAGLPGLAKLLFVPLANARVAPKHLRVQTTKKLAKDGPSIDVDGELDADLEPSIYAYYNLPYATGSGGERRLGRR
jgi:sporulation protein YlmC with PRC-barrel domain